MILLSQPLRVLEFQVGRFAQYMKHFVACSIFLLTTLCKLCSVTGRRHSAVLFALHTHAFQVCGFDKYRVKILENDACALNVQIFCPAIIS